MAKAINGVNFTLDEGETLFESLFEQLNRWGETSDEKNVEAIARTLHTLKGSARMAGAMRLGQHTHELETQIENMVHAGTTTTAAFDELLAGQLALALIRATLRRPAGVRNAGEQEDGSAGTGGGSGVPALGGRGDRGGNGALVPVAPAAGGRGGDRIRCAG